MFVFDVVVLYHVLTLDVQVNGKDLRNLSPVRLLTEMQLTVQGLRALLFVS
jgi:hypothetical protein